MPRPADERPHPGPHGAGWSESWYFDFADVGGTLGGFVRLSLAPSRRVAEYWAYLVRRGEPLLVVRHQEASLPRREALEIREDALWAVLHCETPFEHWTIGLEAFAVGLDDPSDAWREERGELVPLGFDLEWEASAVPPEQATGDSYVQPGAVSGEILVGSDRIEFTGTGSRARAWGFSDPWRTGDAGVGGVPGKGAVPTGLWAPVLVEAAGGEPEHRLVTTLVPSEDGALRWITRPAG